MADKETEYIKIMSQCYTQLNDSVTFENLIFHVEDRFTVERSELEHLNIFDVNQYNKKEL